MKVAAHPMLVAVAFGLLGPAALAAESGDDDDTVTPRPAGTDPSRAPSVGDLDDVVDAMDASDAPAWSRLTLVDAEVQVHPDGEGWGTR
jgi:hypothetical protein